MNEDPFARAALNSPAERDLLLAIKTGKQEIFERALAAGASVEVIDKDGFTPLMLAVMRQRLEMTRTLIERGASVNAATEPFKFTALLFAAELPSIEITQLLLGKGAAVNFPAKHSKTALSAACEEGQFEQVRLLLSAGATATMPGLLVGVLSGGHFEIGKLLLAAGANANDALRDCAYWKQWELVPFLLEAGADPGLKDAEGKSPFDYAEEDIAIYEDRWETYEQDFNKTVRLFRELKERGPAR